MRSIESSTSLARGARDGVDARGRWGRSRPREATRVVVAGARKRRGGNGDRARGGEEASASSSAPRITKRTNGMSVSTQIKLVERFRSLSSKTKDATSGGTGTSGRGAKPIEGARRRGEDPRDRAYEAELARRRMEKKKEERLRGELERFSGRGAPPLLFVDGYNVCGLEENGVKEANDAFQRGDMDAARVALTKEVMDFKSFSGYAVALVWDADRNVDKDEDEIEGDVEVDGFQTVYSVKNDADSWIEARVSEEMEASKKSGGAKRMVYVATSDGALSSIVRGNGAFVISTKAFCDEMRKASQGEREILEEMAIAARWNASKKISRVGVKDDDVKRKLMEMYKTAPSMETPANAPKGDFKRQSETSKAKKGATNAPKWANLRAQRQQRKKD
mgnify:FL=1